MRGWVPPAVLTFIDALEGTFPPEARDTMKRSFQSVRDGTHVLETLSESETGARAQWLATAGRTGQTANINREDAELLWGVMHATSAAMLKQRSA